MAFKSDSMLRGVTIGSIVTVALTLGGYLLVRDDGDSQFGAVMFVLVPMVTGFVVGAIVETRRQMNASLALGGLMTLLYMLMTGLEGLLCIILVVPLLALGLAIGAMFGRLFRRKVIEPRAISRGTMSLLMLIGAPLIIATGDRIEEPTLSRASTEVFSTETIIDASVEETWGLIERMDTLDGTRPFLMTVGLPVPNKCLLDSASVGGNRTCLFENGTITQRITEWSYPRRMALAITGNTLPGRRWLGFTNATYELSEVPGGTRVIRTTEITTRLSPRWYWRELERWGVTSEHEFVFDSIRRRAGEEGGARRDEGGERRP